MTIKLNAGLASLPAQHDAQHKRSLALEIVRGITAGISRRLSRPEQTGRDAAQSARECLDTIAPRNSIQHQPNRRK